MLVLSESFVNVILENNFSILNLLFKLIANIVSIAQIKIQKKVKILSLPNNTKRKNAGMAVK